MEKSIKNEIRSQSTYTKLRRVGEGTYGIVYQGKHEELGRLVALKFLKGGKDAIMRLRDEAWIQGRLNHPNIVSVFGVDMEQGLMVTEYLDSSLEQRYFDTHEIPSIDIAIKIIKQCLDALDYAHIVGGVVHGDIKPGNILLDAENRAKLSDFGVSRLLGMTPKGDSGSTRWAAPEVLRRWKVEGLWHTTFQSDLFSIGIVAYYLLTGKHPFSDPAGLRSTEEMILREDFVPSIPIRIHEAIPKEVIAVVMRLLEKDIHRRYFSANEAMVDLGTRPKLFTYYITGISEMPEAVNDSIIKVVEGFKSLNSKSELFTDFVTSSIIHFGSQAELWKAGRVHVGIDDIEPKGIEIFRKLKKGGFCTFLVKLSSFWDTTKRYYEICREIAKQNKRITRVFVCEDVESLDNIPLLQHISADENAGIQTLIAFSEDITERNAIRDFGIWDDEVLCIVEKDPLKGGSVGCDFIFSETTLNEGRRWKDAVIVSSEDSRKVLLKKISRTIREKPVLLSLLESAPVMKELSEKLCKGSYLNHGSCGWYHGSWQYLRMLDVVSTPDWHGDFYIRSISKLFKNQKRLEVLISGLADYGMLNHLLEGCKVAGTQPRITIIDLCQTPLKICEWYSKKYANQFPMVIETKQADVATYRFPQNSFDLIITDAFLTRFNKSNQQKVVTNWRRSLKPGGYVITTIRIDKHCHKLPSKGTEKDVSSFKGRVWKLAVERSGLVLSELANEKIKKMAEEYAKRMSSYPFRGENEVKELFQGFDTEIEVINTPGEFRLTRYAQVIARKKAV